MALTDAEQDQVDALKRLTGETDLDDDVLYKYITDAGGVNRAASNVWSYKAAQAADLIDIKEGSSTRALSGLRGSALSMAAYFGGLADVETPSAASATRISTIGR